MTDVESFENQYVFVDSKVDQLKRTTSDMSDMSLDSMSFQRKESDATSYNSSPRLICGMPREWFDLMPDDPINNYKDRPEFDLDENDPMYGLWEEQLGADWKHNAFTFKADLAAWQQLSPAERHSLEMILAGFSQADKLIADNCDSAFAGRVSDYTELNMWLNAKAAIEDVHMVTYKQMIKIYIPDPKRREQVLNASMNIPIVKKKIDFLKEGYSSEMTCQEKLVYEICGEGVFFSTSFADIFYYRDSPVKLHVLVESNEYIAADEALHTKADGLLMTTGFKRKLPRARVLEIVTRCVDIECEFVRQRIPVDFVGYNAEQRCNYARYMGDFVLMQMGYEPHWNIPNPCPWMEQGSVKRKGAFHEFGTLHDGYNRAACGSTQEVVVDENDW